MNGSPRTAYELAQEEYRTLLLDYRRALEAKTPSAGELLAQATAAWDRLREVIPHDSLEATVSNDMHLVLVFSYAVGAGDAAEAERVYNTMSADGRKNADAGEAYAPGTVKIWLRGR